jgi:hypothetical protein
VDVKSRRRSALLAVLIVVTVATTVGGTYLRPFLRGTGEAFGALPDGYLSNLIWHGDYLYFVREPPYSSAGANELWQMKPKGKAERVPFGGACAGSPITALAAQVPGQLTLARECGASREIAELDLNTLRLTRVALLKGMDGVLPPVNRIAWAADGLLVSGDGFECSGIGRIEPNGVVPVRSPIVDGRALDVGLPYERRRGACRDLPLGGFVTRVGGSVSFLASPASVGVEPGKRDNSEWQLYRTTNEWGRAQRLSVGFKRPTKTAAFGDCGVLVAAHLRSAGIWLVRLTGAHAELILEGEFSDFAVEPSTGTMAVLGRNAQADSLRLVPHSLDHAAACAS